MFELIPGTLHCAECRTQGDGKRGIIIQNRTAEENYFCPDCWRTLEPQFSWVGVIRILVLTKLGFASPLDTLNLINRLFGSQFHWLKAAPNGFILQGNETKVEQLSLFECV